MCDEAIHIDPYLLEFVHHHFKTEKTCAEAEPYLLKFIRDSFKIQQMFVEALHKAISIEICFERGNIEILKEDLGR